MLVVGASGARPEARGQLAHPGVGDGMTGERAIAQLHGDRLRAGGRGGGVRRAEQARGEREAQGERSHGA